jgi:hypothetical protein
MPRLHRSTLVFAGFATILILAWLTMRTHPSGSSRAPDQAPERPTISERWKVASTPAVALPVVSVHASSVSSPLADSLAARVDGWGRSTMPQDAMLAYEAVADCLKARVEDRMPQDQLEAADSALAYVVGAERVQVLQARRHHAMERCKDLRSDQIESRLTWLRRAAAAGMPGAALAFELEGPDGQGALDAGATSLPAPDAWYEERDEYIAQGLQQCDRVLAGNLAVVARPPGVSLAQAMTFWFGRLQCGDTSSPTPPPLSEDPVAVAYLRHMGRGEPIVPIDGSAPKK